MRKVERRGLEFKKSERMQDEGQTGTGMKGHSCASCR